MERLKRRTDFKAAARGARAPAKAFVLQARARDEDANARTNAARMGFTVSRQVGNAVVRNRVRRRLREMVRLSQDVPFHADHDYVLIGRRQALALAFSDLVRDFGAAVKRIHTAGDSHARPPHGERGRNRGSDAKC